LNRTRKKVCAPSCFCTDYGQISGQLRFLAADIRRFICLKINPALSVNISSSQINQNLKQDM